MRTATKRFRLTAAVAVATAATLSLSACAGSASPSTSASGPTKTTVWIWPGGLSEKVTAAAAPNIKGSKLLLPEARPEGPVKLR